MPLERCFFEFGGGSKRREIFFISFGSFEKLFFRVFKRSRNWMLIEHLTNDSLQAYKKVLNIRKQNLGLFDMVMTIITETWRPLFLGIFETLPLIFISIPIKITLRISKQCLDNLLWKTKRNFQKLLTLAPQLLVSPLRLSVFQWLVEQRFFSETDQKSQFYILCWGIQPRISWATKLKLFSYNSSKTRNKLTWC